MSLACALKSSRYHWWRSWSPLHLIDPPVPQPPPPNSEQPERLSKWQNTLSTWVSRVLIYPSSEAEFSVSVPAIMPNHQRQGRQPKKLNWTTDSEEIWRTLGGVYWTVSSPSVFSPALYSTPSTSQTRTRQKVPYVRVDFPQLFHMANRMQVQSVHLLAGICWSASRICIQLNLPCGHDKDGSVHKI